MARMSSHPLSPHPTSLAGVGRQQGPCWVPCPVPGPPRCPLALRSRRKVGGLQGGLSPCCCLSPPQELHAGVGLWLLPPNNQQHLPVSPSSLHPPSSPSPAPPVSMWEPNPAPYPTPCLPSPRSAPTAPPQPPPSATASSDGGHPQAPPAPPTQSMATQSWGEGTGVALFTGSRGPVGGNLGYSRRSKLLESPWHGYSQVSGAKAKGHSLYPAPT